MEEEEEREVREERESVLSGGREPWEKRDEGWREREEGGRGRGWEEGPSTRVLGLPPLGRTSPVWRGGRRVRGRNREEGEKQRGVREKRT